MDKMGKWIIKIDTKKLREIIDEENYTEVVKELKSAYKSIESKIKKLKINDLKISKEWYSDYLENLEMEIDNAMYLLEGDIEIIKNKEFNEYGFEDAEELLNDRLHSFWDLCDANNIWCSL